MRLRFVSLRRWIVRTLRPRHALGALDHVGHSRSRVLVLGIYLSDQKNTAVHIVRELSRSRFHTVTQRWARIGHRAGAPSVEAVTVLRSAVPLPKFRFLNMLLDDEDLGDYDALMVVDDDIVLPRCFVDAFLELQQKCNFSLCQPARTQNSWIDHAIVRQRKGVLARQTLFVEIGPVFLIHADLFHVLLPFNDAAQMGWGLDFVWPVEVIQAGKKMGIIDAVPIDHSLRVPTNNYDYAETLQQMNVFLLNHAHLSEKEAFTELDVIMLPSP